MQKQVYEAIKEAIIPHMNFLAQANQVASVNDILNQNQLSTIESRIDMMLSNVQGQGQVTGQ